MARGKKKRAARPQAKGPSPAQEAASLRRLVEKQQRTIAELEAKAAKPIDNAAIPAPPPAGFSSMPPPPKDPLAVQQWVGQALAFAIDDTLRDPKLSPRERRKELRTNAAAYAKTVPDMRRWQAEQRAKKFRERLEERASKKGSPPLTTIP
jgi:hypothetical protein